MTANELALLVIARGISIGDKVQFVLDSIDFKILSACSREFYWHGIDGYGYKFSWDKYDVEKSQDCDNIIDIIKVEP